VELKLTNDDNYYVRTFAFNRTNVELK